MVSDERILLLMGVTRAIAGICEFAVACYIWYSGDVRAALRANAMLGLVGPTALVIVAALGLGGLVGRLAWWRVLAIVCGVVLLLIATKE